MKKIYVVWTTHDGEVSYWTTRKKAEKEAVAIIKQFYVDEEAGKSLTNEQLLEEFYDCIGVDEEPLNKSFC